MANKCSRHMLKRPTPAEDQDEDPSAQARPARKKVKTASTAAASRPISSPTSRPTSTSFQFPPAFYDHLSSIRLTRRALWELNRRNKAAACSHAVASSRRLSRRKLQNIPQDSLVSPQRFWPTCNAATKKALKAFARRGGPDLRDILQMPRNNSRPEASRRSRDSGIRKRPAGIASPSASAAASTTSTEGRTSSGKTKSTGPYDTNFAKYLTQAGVFDGFEEFEHGDALAHEPSNMTALRERLRLRRPSLSAAEFTQADFTKFRVDAKSCHKEHVIFSKVLPTVSGNDDRLRPSGGQDRWTNLDPLEPNFIDGKPIVDGNPDLWDGVRVRDVDPQIQLDLDGLIVPTKLGELPILPNFCLAAKGVKGTYDVGYRQALYDGVLSARGMHALQQYRLPLAKSPRGKGVEPAQANEAAVISVIYLAGGHLEFYTITRQFDPRRQRPQYYMHLIETFAILGTRDRFVEAATAFRNARDWAEEVRLETLERAHERLLATRES